MALKPRQVVRAVQRYYEEFPACHGRNFHRFGRLATQAVDVSRKSIQRFVGAREPSEIIFVRNVTEGLNLLATRLSLGAGDVVITTGMEHNSNLLPWQRASRRRGYQHLIVPLTPSGELDRELFEQALDSGRVRLVCTFHRSNVTGVTLPAEWIVDQAHKRGALVAFDGAQAAPHIPLDLRRLGADFYLFSLYKMCGPTGVAVLYGRRELLERIEPLNIGGEGVVDTTYEGYTEAGLPDRLESGLQNYAGIAGAAAAVEWLQGVGLPAVAAHDEALNRQLTQALLTLPGLRLLGPREPDKRGSIVNFVMEGLDSIELAHLLDRSEGIMVRAGKQCAHSWYNAHGVPESVRISLYAYNTPQEVERLVTVLEKIAREFR